MSKPKLTEEMVSKIEWALEERKNNMSPPPGLDERRKTDSPPEPESENGDDKAD